MGKLLQDNISTVKGSRLTKEDTKFRIAFEVKLANGFEIKDMEMKHNAEFHNFISETVYKELTISEVDKLFLRKQGLGSAPPVKYGDIELIHYGKDMKPFRLFGYYNKDGYFVVCRIDGKHKTNRQ